MINWDDFRREDKSIDLVAAWSFMMGDGWNSKAVSFLERIESLQPVVSRQAAAVAIAWALEIPNANV
jgi:hypothetical protein